jgi:hypothetical protein
MAATCLILSPLFPNCDIARFPRGLLRGAAFCRVPPVVAKLLRNFEVVAATAEKRPSCRRHIKVTDDRARPKGRCAHVSSLAGDRQRNRSSRLADEEKEHFVSKPIVSAAAVRQSPLVLDAARMTDAPAADAEGKHSCSA